MEAGNATGGGSAVVWCPAGKKSNAGRKERGVRGEARGPPAGGRNGEKRGNLAGNEARSWPAGGARGGQAGSRRLALRLRHLGPGRTGAPPRALFLRRHPQREALQPVACGIPRGEVWSLGGCCESKVPAPRSFFLLPVLPVPCEVASVTAGLGPKSLCCTTGAPKKRTSECFRCWFCSSCEAVSVFLRCPVIASFSPQVRCMHT